jgi:hypothetical protein
MVFDFMDDKNYLLIVRHAAITLGFFHGVKDDPIFRQQLLNGLSDQ